MRLTSWFLPVGVLLAVVLGLRAPEAGRWAGRASPGSVSAGKIRVIVIFFMYGWELDTGVRKSLDRKFLQALAAVLLVGLAGGPALVPPARALLGLDGATAAGLAVMCCVPTTLSSAVVIADAAGGSRVWALSFTLAMNTVGVFVLPFTLGLLLGGQGEGGARLEIREVPMLIQMLQTVILPMAAGVLFRLVTRIRAPRGAGYVPSTCIILVVWMAVAANAGMLAGSPPDLLLRAEAAVVGVHVVLLAASRLAGWALRVDLPGAKAMTFVGSQKTLPVSVAVVMILREGVPSFAGMAGGATVVCVMFHVSQIVLDSLISGWWRARPAHGVSVPSAGAGSVRRGKPPEVW